MNMINESVIKLSTPQKNSKGELSYYAIKQHRTGKILSRHKTKEEAQKRLKQIEMFKHMKEDLLDNTFNILNEEVNEKIIIAITNTLIDNIKNKTEKKVYSGALKNITELFQKYIETDFKIYFTYNLIYPKTDTYVSPVKEDKNIDLVLKADFYKSGVLNEQKLFDILSHEIVHVIDLIKSKGNRKKQKKGYEKESHSYFNDTHEFNALIYKIKTEYRLNKEFKKYFNEVKNNYSAMLELLYFLERKRLIPKHFIKDENFRKKLYKRLVREKLI